MTPHPRRHARALAAALAVAALSDPLAQQRDAPARPGVTGTGVIAGMVVSHDAAAPAPVRRAVVTLTGTGIPAPLQSTTDDAGRFAMTELPGGRFTLTVEKPGFDPCYGAFGPGLKLRQSGPVCVRSQHLRARRRRSKGQRLPAGSGTKVEDVLPIFRLTGQRNQLAALVLYLEQALLECGMIVQARIGRKTQTPWTDACRLGSLDLAEQLLAMDPRDIGPEVDRRPFQQCGPLSTGNMVGEKWLDPCRNQ